MDVATFVLPLGGYASQAAIGVGPGEGGGHVAAVCGATLFALPIAPEPVHAANAATKTNAEDPLLRTVITPGTQRQILPFAVL